MTSAQPKVIWSEGMLLKPQHFQQQDRYFAYLCSQHSINICPYLWGINNLEIDNAALKSGKIIINTCDGILPDGTFFNAPQNCASPLARDIPLGTNNTTIYLCLPLHRYGMVEVGSDHNCRYQIDTLEINDYNDDKNYQPIQTAKLNLRLILEQENRSAYSYINIIRIKETRQDRTIVLDEKFIPSCNNINSATIIKNFIAELIGLLDYRAESIANRITTSNQSSTAEITDFMLLQLINRYIPVLTHLTNLKGVHPLNLYRTLIGLVSELATFIHRTRRTTKLPIYQHDNLSQTFSPLMQELHLALSTVLEQNTTSIPLEPHQHGVWVASIMDKTLLLDATFILAVYADMPTKEIQTHFPNQTKISSVEQIRSLVTRALPGIDLELLATAPRQIPYHTNFIYFALNRKHAFWDSLAKSGGIAFHIGGNFPGLKLELWTIRG